MLLALSLVFLVTILSWHLRRRALRGDPRDAWLRILAQWVPSIGATRLQGADQGIDWGEVSRDPVSAVEDETRSGPLRLRTESAPPFPIKDAGVIRVVNPEFREGSQTGAEIV